MRSEEAAGDSGDTEAEAWDRADAARGRGGFALAASLWETLDHDPDAVFDAGGASHDAGEPERAIALLAAAADRGVKAAHLDLALLLEKTGDHSAAMRAVERGAAAGDRGAAVGLAERIVRNDPSRALELVAPHLSHHRFGAAARRVAREARTHGASLPLSSRVRRPRRAKLLRAREPARAELRRLMEARTFVSVRRTPRHADQLDGFVAAVGRKWVLLQVTRSGGYLDGWYAVRIDDLLQVRIEDESFESRVAAQQPEWPPTPPIPIDLDRTVDLLRSVRSEGLVGVERERKRPAIWIGRIIGMDSGVLSLVEVDPQARWKSTTSTYRLGAITTVALRTQYLVALESVAGERPTRTTDPSNAG